MYLAFTLFLLTDVSLLSVVLPATMLLYALLAQHKSYMYWQFALVYLELLLVAQYTFQAGPSQHAVHFVDWSQSPPRQVPTRHAVHICHAPYSFSSCSTPCAQVAVHCLCHGATVLPSAGGSPWGGSCPFWASAPGGGGGCLSSGWGWGGVALSSDGGGGYPSAYAHCSGALGDPAVQWWLDAVGLHVRGERRG